jgi:metal-dependent amidase/aminoacylase/carboxypeptidase family protein
MVVDQFEEQVDRVVAGLTSGLVDLRRSIHRRPELAGTEVATAALVADALRSAGLAVSTSVGGHGVIGVLTGDLPGGSVGYRADMDAVADEESSLSKVRSQVSGAAHLCGHDLHTAIGVGVARTLAHFRDRLPGRAVFYFQPAEETLSGAQAMLDHAAVVSSLPEEIYALHCGPFPTGTFGIMPGVGASGHDNFDLELIGRDEISRGDAVANKIAQITTVHPPASADGLVAMLADLQRSDGPYSRFVFAGSRTTGHPSGRYAHLHGWIKAWPDDAYEPTRQRVRTLVRNGLGAAVADRLAFRDRRAPAMVCSPTLSNTAGDYIRSKLGSGSVTVLHAMLPFNGEDFGIFLNRIPGAMFFLGVANPAKNCNGQIHSPGFTADEDAISIATRVMTGWLASRLSARRRTATAA